MSIPVWCIGCRREGLSHIDCDYCREGSNFQKPNTDRVIDVVKSTDFANAYESNDFDTIKEMLNDLCLDD